MTARSALLLLFAALLTAAAQGADLKFKLNVSPGVAPPEVAAQAVALFLSAHTGVDFTRWLVYTPKGIASDPVAVDLQVDVPAADLERVREAVEEYIKSKQLDSDFALQGIPDVFVSFRKDARPTPSPTPSNSLPLKPSLSPSPSTSRPPMPPPSPIENEKEAETSVAPSEIPRPSESALPIESMAPSEAPSSSEPPLPSALPQPSTSPSASLPSPTEEPEDFDELPAATTSAAPSWLAERDKQLPSDATLSAPFELDVHSPEFNFNAGMRDAIKWFLANHTDTPADSWRLWDVVELEGRRYSVDLRLAAPADDTSLALESAAAFVRSQRLTAELRAAGATDVLVTLAGDSGPAVPVPSAYAEVGDEISDPAHPPLANTSEIALMEKDILLPLYLNVSSPVHGFGNKLSMSILQFFARETGTESDDWALRNVEKSGPQGFAVEYAVRVEKNRREDTAKTIVRLVRERKLDRYLAEQEFEMVNVRLLPHLLNSDISADGKKKKGAFSPSAGTITASVVGIILVVAIGAAILCLVPRGGRS